MQNLIELLKETAQKYPKNKAVIYKNKAIRYRQLVSEVVRLGLRLSRLNIRRGDRVGILLGNCSDFVISYFAILNREATVVPLNHFLKPEELKRILEDCNLRFLITNSKFSKTVEFLRREASSLEDVLFVDADITQILSFLKMPLKNFGFAGLKSIAKRPDVAVILYTSGTTGQPKGAMLTHGNLLFDVFACAEAIEVKQSDNFICMLPLFHSFPSTVCMLLPLAKGGTMTILEGVRPFSKVIEAILRHRVTAFVSVPAVYNVLVHMRILKILTLPFISPLRLCISGAAALPADTLNKFQEKFRVPLLEGYGLTETSPVVSLNSLRGVRVSGSIGKPLEGVEVKIIDEQGRPVSIGEVGELVVKGGNVMKGYFNRQEETEEALRDGWLHTGDLAKIDDKGFIYIVDRKKDMINVRGLKVYPREVEEIFFRHPAVKEVAVVGLKDEHHGEIPKAFLVLKERRKVTEQEFLRYLRKNIASYKVPRSIEFRDSLPKTSSGKVSKRELIEEFT
ncbi:MAG: long-chain fatty acid--CoA ligase [Candidatus Omnitrophica bacterium]|nr:long-chain fatty acid--CoA ligase [Candidatus Omnitrophota bacterium]